MDAQPLVNLMYGGPGLLLEGLQDPEFGCYGAKLMTWLMDGRRPLTVTAVTQQLQAENNP